MAKKAKKVLTKEEKAARNKKRLENYNPVMAARNALRREFSRSPVVIDMMNDPATSRKVPVFKKDGTRAKVDAREHLCNECGEWKRSSKGRKATIDHVEPVVEPKVGYVDLNTYFTRMWVPRDKLQKLCGDCHNKKTQAEWGERRYKEELLIVEEASKLQDKKLIKKKLQRFTKKKWATWSYPQEFIDRVEALKKAARAR